MELPHRKFIRLVNVRLPLVFDTQLLYQITEILTVKEELTDKKQILSSQLAAAYIQQEKRMLTM